MNNFDKFIKLFETYNIHTNLMSSNDISKLQEKHIPDCLAINLFFNKYGIPKTLIDIGTGGGLPSIPIALQYPKINVFALDSVTKKIRFIENVKNELNLQNLFPICQRIENYDKRNFFDIAVTRAVACLPTILEYCAAFVKLNGYIVSYKAKTADEEIQLSQNASKILGVKFLEKIIIPQLNYDMEERCLIIFQKIKTTPLKFPRNNNLARKKHL